MNGYYQEKAHTLAEWMGTAANGEALNNPVIPDRMKVYEREVDAGGATIGYREKIGTGTLAYADLPFTGKDGADGADSTVPGPTMSGSDIIAAIDAEIGTDWQTPGAPGTPGTETILANFQDLSATPQTEIIVSTAGYSEVRIYGNHLSLSGALQFQFRAGGVNVATANYYQRDQLTGSDSSADSTFGYLFTSSTANGRIEATLRNHNNADRPTVVESFASASASVVINERTMADDNEAHDGLRIFGPMNGGSLLIVGKS